MYVGIQHAHRVNSSCQYEYTLRYILLSVHPHIYVYLYILYIQYIRTTHNHWRLLTLGSMHIGEVCEATSVYVHVYSWTAYSSSHDTVVPMNGLGQPASYLDGEL